jgi:hypothetical protein
MATLNHVHMTQIQHDINTITKSLPTLDFFPAELSHLQAGELKLTLSLNHIQISALNRTINIMNYRSITIENLGIVQKYLGV